MMRHIEELLPLLTSPQKIFITTHYKPDGDAIGSSLGLYHYLIRNGHEVTVVSPSEIPDFLQWMPGIEQVLNFESEPKMAEKALTNCDYIFCLDFNNLSRIKNLENLLRSATQPKVLIDHHLEPESSVFHYGISLPEKSSTCEMIYDFILLDNGGQKINTEIMQCLYSGTMTDTGSFRFPSTTASVHLMIADFKRRGFDHSVIHDRIFDNWSAQRMRFLGFVLSERMEVYPLQKTGLITISQEDIHKYSDNVGATEGMVNYPLGIAGIEKSILLIERKDEVKLSFRSKGDIDVALFTRTYFNGGGHKNAAGGQSKESLKDTKNKIINLLNLKN